MAILKLDFLSVVHVVDKFKISSMQGGDSHHCKVVCSSKPKHHMQSDIRRNSMACVHILS